MVDAPVMSQGSGQEAQRGWTGEHNPHPAQLHDDKAPAQHEAGIVGVVVCVFVCVCSAGTYLYVCWHVSECVHFF
jgi:hypothetical protein